MNANLPPPIYPSPEELSQRRLDQLTEVAAKLHQEIPEFLGMTAFGSIVRGAAKPESDVDICVFMDLTDSQLSAQKNHHVSSETKVGRSAELISTFVFHPAIDLDYMAAVIGHLPEQEIVEPDIIVLPLSKDIVNLSTDILLENTQHYSKVVHLNGLDTGIPRNIRCLFHAPVDTEQLQPYIEQVLTKLSAGKDGEKAWQMLRHMVVGFEQGRQGEFEENPHRTIPKTLADARKHYGLE